jgi:Fe-S cluster biogenesis protein NfuA
VDDAATRDRVARVDTLLDEIESLTDPAREKALDVVQALVELYGEGLARIVSSLPAAAGEALAEDELVEHLLLLHDLHPVPLEERVRAAVEANGDGVDVVSVEDGVARLRMRGDCTKSTTALKTAIAEAVPDVEEIVVAEQAGPEIIQLPQAAGA